MRWVGVLALVMAAGFAGPAYAHDRNLSGVRLRQLADALVVTVDTHRAELGEGDPLQAIADRLRLRINGAPYRPARPVLGKSPEKTGVVWEDRVPIQAHSVSIEGTLYPENPNSRLAVVFYDRGVALRGAMLGPDRNRWEYQRISGSISPPRGIANGLRWAGELLTSSRLLWIVIGLMALANSAGSVWRFAAGMFGGFAAAGTWVLATGTGMGRSGAEASLAIISVLLAGRLFLDRPNRPAMVGPVLLSDGFAVGLIQCLALPMSNRGATPDPLFLLTWSISLAVAASGFHAAARILFHRVGLCGVRAPLPLRRMAAGTLVALAVSFAALSSMPGRP